MAGLPPDVIAYQIAHIDDNKTDSIIASNVITLFAACVAVVLRLCSRFLKRLTLQPDDYLILAALFFSASFVASDFTAVHYGLGRHLILVKDPVAFAKSIIATEAFYGPCQITIKVSILWLYHRIFPGPRFFTLCQVITLFVICANLSCWLAVVCYCIPIQAQWDPTIPATCIDVHAVLIFHGVQTVVTDFLILVLPMPQLWQLKLPLKRKLEVTSILALGALVSVFSIIRVTTVNKLSLTDASWDDVDSALWSIVEVNLGIVCACLPTVRPVINYVFRIEDPSTSSKTRSSRRQFSNLHSNDVEMVSSIAEGPGKVGGWGMGGRKGEGEWERVGSSVVELDGEEDRLRRNEEVWSERERESLRRGSHSGIKVTTNVRLESNARVR